MSIIIQKGREMERNFFMWYIIPCERKRKNVFFSQKNRGARPAVVFLFLCTFIERQFCNRRRIQFPADLNKNFSIDTQLKY